MHKQIRCTHFAGPIQRRRRRGHGAHRRADRRVGRRPRAMTTTEADIVPYPVERLERYRAAGVPGEQTIAAEFRSVADAHPDRPALMTASETLTYAELDERTDRVAIGLRGLGLEPGERVLMQFTNTGWAVVVWYGLIKAGLVPVATLAQHREHEIFDIAAQSGASAHLIETTFRGQDLTALAQATAQRTPSLRTLLTIGTDTPPPNATTTESLLASGPDDPAQARRQAGTPPGPSA